MKKLSKVATSFTHGLKNITPLLASVAMGGTAIGVVAADYQERQANEVAAPAPVAEPLTPAQNQEVLNVLRTLRIKAEDNLTEDLAWINTEIAVKLTHTLGETVETTSSRELLTIIDDAIAKVNATLTQTADHGLER